jgi:hypothetical protein
MLVSLVGIFLNFLNFLPIDYCVQFSRSFVRFSSPDYNFFEAYPYLTDIYGLVVNVCVLVVVQLRFLTS